MESILNALYAAYAPEALILYGSYADGTNGEGSDFDALVLADHMPYHDVSFVEGVQLDVWVYPADHFTSNDALAEVIQIEDGILVHDPHGQGAELQRRVRALRASQPGKSAGDNAESLAWCRKMLQRAARADAEGLFRWHWLLTESLEIACDLLHQPYPGPKKALRWLEKHQPELYAVYLNALSTADHAALADWIAALEALL